MSAVFSTRLLAVAGGNGSFTIPVGRVAVVRSISALNVNAGANAAFGVTATPTPYTIWHAALPQLTDDPAHCFVLADLRQVINAGEVLNGQCPAGGYLTVSGYLLSLP